MGTRFVRLCIFLDFSLMKVYLMSAKSTINFSLLRKSMLINLKKENKESQAVLKNIRKIRITKTLQKAHKDTDCLKSDVKK